MKVNRAVAKQLFLEIGWNSASSKMNKDEWVQEKLNAVPKNVEDVEFESEEAKELANAICKALEDGKEIEFELEGEVESVSEKPTKGKKSAAKEEKPAKGKKASKPEKGEKKEKKEAREKDKFGSYKGSSNAAVNAVLGKKPLSFSQIVEKSGLNKSKVRYAHLDGLVEAGHAVRTEEGWALKK